MVRGITTNLKYPLTAFGTTGVTADFQYPIMWKAIRVLEINCELKVSFISCDGATPDDKYFDLHRLPLHEDNIIHWTPNPYSTDGRKCSSYQTCHMKLVRNCFSNSCSHQKARRRWTNGETFLGCSVTRIQEHVEQNTWSFVCHQWELPVSSLCL